jgi:1,4-dihydroxy-2-naphthoate octaprenyltransferase
MGYFAAVKYDGRHEVFRFLLILLAGFLVHLAANLSNDVFDHILGVDSKDSIGGSRVIQDGVISPGRVKLATFFCYVAAFALAIEIVKGDAALWIVVIFAALSSFFYVAPPIKYGHRGLGELFVFLNMGLIMTAGCHWALTERFDPRVLSLALPIGLMVAQVLYFQSLPEIDDDPLVGKRTLASILGKERATLIQLLWWPLIWLTSVNLWCSGLLAWPALLGPLSFPMHWFIVRKTRRTVNWRELDRHGRLVRILYSFNAICLVAGLVMIEPDPSTVATPLQAPATIQPAAGSENREMTEPQDREETNPQAAVPSDSEPRNLEETEPQDVDSPEPDLPADADASSSSTGETVARPQQPDSAPITPTEITGPSSTYDEI